MGGRDSRKIGGPDDGWARDGRIRNSSTKDRLQSGVVLRKRVPLKEGVSRFTFFSAQGFKARTDATVDPHENGLQLSHFGNELGQRPHDTTSIEALKIVKCPFARCTRDLVVAGGEGRMLCASSNLKEAVVEGGALMRRRGRVTHTIVINAK